MGTRSTVINLRADKSRRALIDRAAEAVGKNRSEFMLDAATREATTVLLDRRFFELDPRTFKRFAAALDGAPSDNPGAFARCVCHHLHPLEHEAEVHDAENDHQQEREDERELDQFRAALRSQVSLS